MPFGQMFFDQTLQSQSNKISQFSVLKWKRKPSLVSVKIGFDQNTTYQLTEGLYFNTFLFQYPLLLKASAFDAVNHSYPSHIFANVAWVVPRTPYSEGQALGLARKY